MDVRIASARRDLIEGNDMIANNPEYMLAAALLLQCEENCAEQPPIKETVSPKTPKIESSKVEPKIEPKVEVEVDSTQPQNGSHQAKAQPIEQKSDEKSRGNNAKGKDSSNGKKDKGKWTIIDIFKGIKDDLARATEIKDNDY